MNVNLILRKSSENYFSMENVFATILPFLRESANVEIKQATRRNATPFAVAQNLLHFKKFRPDVAHITGDIHYAVFAFPQRHVVLTIHDCVFLHKTKGLRKLMLLWFWHKLPVRYARYITTISEATKKDIINITGCSPSKISVIRNPADPDFEYHPKKFNDERPVILQLGTWQNKNLERVVEAIEGLECTLYIIGKLSGEQETILKEKNIDFVNEFNLTKKELISFYVKSDLVVFVSTFEGFGLPIIEAQAIGRPLITSNIDPMKEVAGKGAHLVDPYNVEDIKRGIKKIVGDPLYRESLILEGLKNITQFQPAKIAEQYLELYEKIAAN